MIASILGSYFGYDEVNVVILFVIISEIKLKLSMIKVKTNTLDSHLGIYFLVNGIRYIVFRISLVKNQKIKAKIKGIRIPFPITNVARIAIVITIKYAAFFTSSFDYKLLLYPVRRIQTVRVFI